MTDYRYFIGVDPGQGGAVALLDTEDFTTLEVWDTPIKKVKGKNRLDEQAFADLVDCFSKLNCFAVVEEVHAMPKQGVSSTFSFGLIYGMARMALSYADIPHMLVTPSRWKLSLGVTSNKDTCLFRASDLFPGRETLWIGPKGGVNYDRCEAALLAYYGYTQRDRIAHHGPKTGKG